MCVPGILPEKKRAVPLWASEEGLTLVEIFIAVAIVVIGTTLGITAYQGWTARADLKAATTEVSHTLTFGRTAAMNRNSTVTISLALVGQRVQLSTGGVSPPTMLASRVTGFSGGPVSFSSLGMRVGGPVAANQLVTLTNSDGLVYSIAVAPGGKTRWCAKATCP